ncbi:MAG TPA: DsbA family protein [Solirubrobacteraceae bacterium]
MTAATGQPTFYYDLGDPWSYVVAERILSELPELAEWQPVHGAQLGWTAPELDAGALGAAVAEHRLQPLRLPSRWPPNTRLAMLAATFAKSGGRTVGFSLAAFRQAFAGGRDLSDEATVLIAAAAAEMHPRSVLAAVGMRSVAATLRRAGDRALEAGVRALPAIDVGDELFSGPDALERATTALLEGVARGR